MSAEVHAQQSAVLSAPESSATIRTRPSEQRHVYDLRRGNNCSDNFFSVLPSFVDQILLRIERRASPLLDGYARHIERFRAEAPRSRGEYALDFLLLGMALSQYEGAAQRTPRWIVEVARDLTFTRERWQKAKPLIDWIRAGLASYSLAPNISRRPGVRGSAIERLARLGDWLESTGEFKQEAMRLQNWRSCLAELSPQKATCWLHAACELFSEFERESNRVLHAYTRGVEPYLAQEHAGWHWREDLLMCARPPVEYHLNMVAAEIMNRGLREAYASTTQKVLLVPGCMRGWRSTCRARIDGVDITCGACDPDCAVNRITRMMREHDIAVYIVPHGGAFSRWLARWQNTGVGVTAVACVLNIFAGGLEMRERGIAAQCLPLDFPGCRKHWDANGFSTAVNEARLVQIAAVQSPPH